MNKKQIRTTALLLGILFIAWVSAAFMNNRPRMQKRKSDFIFPSTDVQHFTFGFNEVMADLYWLRTIQDFDVCVYPKAAKDAPRTGLNRQAHCEMDWAYHMLEVITTLAPRNLIAYSAGGVMLSVVLDDVKGATFIYRKALRTFTDDWSLDFQAATHFMSEVGDIYSAAFYYDRAVKNGAPFWAAALSAKLFDKVGRTELAIANLKAQLKRGNSNEKFVEAVEKKLYELEEKLAREKAEKSRAR